MLTSVSNPDLHLLRVFVTVAEAGGFSRAQIALNVSQSTISTQMIDLETRLGMRLCRRGRAGFALTEEGHEIYQFSKALIRDCEKFTSKIRSMRGDISGELRIALADAMLGQKNFPFDTILADLRESMPAVTLQLNVLDPLEIERLILEKKLHMGLHTFPNHAPGLRYIKMFEEVQTLYCGKKHPLFDCATEPALLELAKYDYASRSYYGGSLQPGILIPKNPYVQSANMEGIAAAILSGKFLGHLPEQSAKNWVSKGLMKALGPEKFCYKATFECVFPVGAGITRAQKALEEVMIKHSIKSKVC